jgi:RND family efflux transporter MFP subunit
VSVRTHGSVEPRSEIDLIAEIPGRVAYVSPSLEPGRFFEAGELLVEIDRADAELALERARARLLRSQSEVQLAQARLERLRALQLRNISSASKLEESDYAHRIARAQEREARAGVGQAERTLQRTRILAPFAGLTREKRIDVGQFVSREALLARIHAVDFAEVRLPIPNSELAFLELPGRQGADDGPPVILRAQYAGRPAEWTGVLVRSEAEFEARSRMLHVVVRVDDPYDRRHIRGGPPLSVGLFVEAEIQGRLFPGIFVLPRSALRAPGEVAVVGEDGQLRARSIDVLRIEGEQLLVRSGLESGERVVTTGVGTIDGSRVRAVPVLAEDAPFSLAEKRR